eukprot:263917_1
MNLYNSNRARIEFNGKVYNTQDQIIYDEYNAPVFNGCSIDKVVNVINVQILSGDILPDLDKQDHFKSLKHRVKSVSMKRHTRKRNRECEVNEIINYNIEDNKRKKRRKLN